MAWRSGGRRNPTIRPRWRWPPSTATACPTCAWCCSRASTPAGFVFFTNFESAKGSELLANPKAALCFHWKSLRRSVRVRGPVSQVVDAEADAYFASRAARQPDRRLGEQAVAAAGIALRAGEGGRRPTRRNSASARSRVRTTGPGSASRPRRSSSGRTGRSGCTTGSGSRGPATAGRRRGFIPERAAGGQRAASASSGSVSSATTAVSWLSGRAARFGCESGVGVGSVFIRSRPA